MNDYADFLASKQLVVRPSGVTVADDQIHPSLFPFQRDLTRWALRKGRSAIFADTGLGKTRMQIEWARLTGERTLIVAPLAVAQQTIREGALIGVPIEYRRAGEHDAPMVITNYEMVEQFNPADFGAVVLDESSILKNHDGKTRTRLIQMFSDTPFRLACSATPAPNDVQEFANHSEFLGVLSRVDMLATFFVHDDEGWRLKGHAREPFYRWMASWGMSVRKPSDLGYDDGPFALPPLRIEQRIVSAGWEPEGRLFAAGLSGITERAQVRRASAGQRAQAVADLVNGGSEPWLVWVGLNAEQEAVADLIPGAVVVQGADSPETKAEALLGFQDGAFRVLITKPSIAGFGLNFQHCSHMVFCGLGDSYEQYYQAIRRCWRFGQTRPVTAWVVLSEPEQHIYANVKRKEREAIDAAERMVAHVAEYEREEIVKASASKFDYATADDEGEGWRFWLGDSCERMADIEEGSVGFSVFSPPFESLYTYSPTERDLGNSSSPGEFWDHFAWISDHLLRVLMPGRLAAVHVQQLPLLLSRHGVIGMRDFRGDTIRHFQDRGFIYHGEVCIDKDPQAQAIRTKAKSLMFQQLHKDSSWMRPAFADYILLFRKPGDNPEPIVNDWITNDEWIQWARPIWYNIRESDTLNVAEARSNDDERHIAPLQLETIRRAVLLWSNRGDMVLSPFAGIGSEGYVAIQEGRQFLGIELKPEYFKVGVKNLREAERLRDADTLLSLIAPEE